jgi:hypothetical protein
MNQRFDHPPPLACGGKVSYFLSGWISIAVSGALALVTFLIGLRLMHQVITITNEVR